MVSKYSDADAVIWHIELARGLGGGSRVSRGLLAEYWGNHCQTR